MKKNEVVKRKEDFNQIINNCPFFKNKFFTIYIRKKEEINNNYGLAISKKVGNAVQRNKLKRQLRVIIDKNKQLFPKRCDYIIMIKKPCIELNFQGLNDNLIRLLKENI